METKLDNLNGFRGLGVFINNSKPTILYASDSYDQISQAISSDGLEFEKKEGLFEILDATSKKIDHKKIQNLRISPIFKNFILFSEENMAGEIQVFSSISKDGNVWSQHTKLPKGIGLGLNVDSYVYNNQHVFYFGGDGLRLGLTDTGENWEFKDIEGIDNNIEIDFTLKTSQGIFLIYHHYSIIQDKKCLEVKAICLDKNDPTKIIWKTKTSLWQEPMHWIQKNASCMGTIYFQGKLLSYWNVESVGIFLVTYPLYDETPSHEHKHFKLDKHPKNPILSPHPVNDWENEATFNPAAFYEGGTVYLIYRAVGHDYISVLGCAESSDGINFDRKFDSPIFTGNSQFDTRSPKASFETTKKFISGGGYGGCEDPRITKIDDRLYMVYVAFNGYSEPRLALTSILYENFINHRFLWEKPVLISPPGIIDKSGCILPEKINGKYVIFHRIYPNILIDFVDNLNFDGKTWLKGEFKIEPRPTMWDSRKIGTGAPPIKTKDGWLLIYQGVTDQDDSKYRIGAMMLDINDPTKVLYRANHPIIEPTEYYENNLAKFGVVYPCGAVILNEQLFVYYGGSDSVTCVATTNLNEFLKELKEGTITHFRPIKLND